MVAICAGEYDREAEMIYEELRAAWIPCALVGPKYGFTDTVFRVPFVVLSGKSNVWNESIRRKIHPAHILSCSGDRHIAGLLYQKMFEIYHINMQNYAVNGIYITNSLIRFRSCVLRLTRNELKILRLLAFCTGHWFSGDEVAAYCLRGDARAAAVHICNMNEKAVRSIGFKMIQTRRYHGYCVEKI